MTIVRSGNVLFAALFLASCGGSGNDQTTIVVTPPGPGPSVTPTISTAPVFTSLSFSSPVALLQAPADSSRWFVVEKAGRVRVFENVSTVASATTFIDISGVVDSRSEGGLLGLAFDPDFPTTPDAYLSYTRTGSPLVSYVSRFSSSDGGLTLDPATESVILTVDQPDDNHNGGDLAFGPDGFLYVGFGDGGGGGDPDGNGQDTMTLMGAIVRLDVTGGSPYGIPAGNPFESNPVCTGGVGTADCPEIFAWGLRNPWRFSFDTTTAKLWVGDVGQSSWEEINVIAAGDNLGWNVREGANCFSPASGCATTFVEPITQYDRAVGQSVTGGFVYRGSAIAELVGWYVFADFVSGRIMGVPEASASLTTFTEFTDTGLSVASFGRANDGELFLLDFSGGSIHQLVDAP